MPKILSLYMQTIMFKDFIPKLWLPMNLEDFLQLPDSLLFCPLSRFHFFPKHSSFAINGFKYILKESKLLFLFIFFPLGKQLPSTYAISHCCHQNFLINLLKHINL